MDLGEMGWKGVNWIQLAQENDQWRSLVSTVRTFEFYERR